MIKPHLLALAAIGLGILTDIFFYDGGSGLSFPLFWATLLGCVLVFDRLTHRHLKVREIVVMGSILVLSAFAALRASEFLMTLNTLAILYLFLLLLASLYGASVNKFRLTDFVLFPFMDVMIQTILSSEIFAHILRFRERLNARIATGLAIGAGFVFLFILLFASADAVFSETIRKFWEQSDLTNAVDHAVFITIASAGLLLLLAPAFWKKFSARPISEFEAKKDFGVESVIIFAGSNAVFLLFLAFQAVYLFGGRNNLEQFGLTFAEYARQGFFQLLVVSLIVTAMIWAMRHVKSGPFTNANRVLQTTLILQTFVVLASSWTRLSLYESAFGFTHLRLFSHTFLIVVAAILVILIVSLASELRSNTILQASIGVFVAALIGLNLLNPDLFIAQQNIANGLKEKLVWEQDALGWEYEGVDVRYLVNDLSDDAAPAIAGYFSKTRDSSENTWFLKWLERETPTTWQSWNLARVRAGALRAAMRAELPE